MKFTVSAPAGATPPVTIQQGDPDEGEEDPYPSCDGSDDQLSIRCGLRLEPGANKYPMYLFRDKDVDVIGLYADGTTEDLSKKVSLTVRMSYPTDAEQVRVASGETHTKADAASGDEILPVTDFSLGGYLAVGAGVIGLGAVIMLLASRRAARQQV